MKRLSLLLALLTLLTACSARPEPQSAPAPKPVTQPAATPVEPEPKPTLQDWIGISMANETDDGQRIQLALEEKGYAVELQFAQNNAALQIQQLENMIENGAKTLVIAETDGEALAPVLERAKNAGITVLYYDWVNMEASPDGKTYAVIHDRYEIGKIQAEYLIDMLDLPNAGDKTYSIEFVTGDPEDAHLPFYNNDAFSLLAPYLSAGTLVVRSGQTNPMDCTTAHWDSEAAQARFEDILESHYVNQPLHAVLSTSDSLSQGVIQALAAHYDNATYPIITGWGCEISAVQHMLEGKQAMSVFEDRRDLAAKAAEMVDAIMQGIEPETNDVLSWGNTDPGTILIYRCPCQVCTADNYTELLIDSGYYTKQELEK